MVPAFALLLTDLATTVSKAKKRKLWHSAKSLAMTIVLLLLTVYVIISFNFRPYSTFKYYKNFFNYTILKISKEEYENSFDSIVDENRQVSQIINEMGAKRIFIWGTNALLYAQSRTIPTSRFTVSFHIKDFNDYDRTFAQIEKEQPKLIIIMNNETQEFPQLTEYLTKYYLVNNQFANMTLYLKQ